LIWNIITWTLNTYHVWPAVLIKSLGLNTRFIWDKTQIGSFPPRFIHILSKLIFTDDYFTYLFAQHCKKKGNASLFHSVLLCQHIQKKYFISCNILISYIVTTLITLVFCNHFLILYTPRLFSTNVAMWHHLHYLNAYRLDSWFWRSFYNDSFKILFS
jgi:hypothetical protein